MEAGATLPAPVLCRRVEVDGIDVFYRECGAPDAPTVLLLHGYPCSSFEFRNLMPLLGDRWHLVAPDFPASGFSATPDDFDYSFSGFAAFTRRLVEKLNIGRFSLYLHDFGTWIGLQLAMALPDRLTALVVQNGDIYEDALGDKYAPLLKTLALPPHEARLKLLEGISHEEFAREFMNGIPHAYAARVPPELLELHWSLMTAQRKAIQSNVILDWRSNFAWFPKYQQWLRERQPPTLIIWGPHDGYMPEKSARAWLRDLPHAELHLLDGGHWLLETHLAEVARHMREFLAGLRSAAS